MALHVVKIVGELFLALGSGVEIADAGRAIKLRVEPERLDLLERRICGP
jgi:hypothetical protein